MSPPPGPPRPSMFPNTSLTLIDETKRRDESGRRALEQFTELYFPVIQRLMRRLVWDPERAAELTNEFFATVVLHRRILDGYDPSKGRLRWLLRRAVVNLVREHRPKPQADVPMPRQIATSDEAIEVQFDREWARMLVHQALDLARDELRERGDEWRFELFYGFYILGHSWEDLGRPYGGNGRAARHWADPVAKAFQRAMIVIIQRHDPDACSAEDGAAAREEIRDLIRSLQLRGDEKDVQ